jgi:hypothetical protein
MCLVEGCQGPLDVGPGQLLEVHLTRTAFRGQPAVTGGTDAGGRAENLHEWPDISPVEAFALMQIPSPGPAGER